MADRRNAKRNTREEDQILRFSIIIVVILFVAAGIFVGVRLLNPREDVTAGREKLEELTSVNVAEVESAILVVDRGADEDEADEAETEESESQEDETQQDVTDQEDDSPGE